MKPAAPARLPKMFAGRRRGLLLQLVANGFAQAGAAVATLLLVRRTFDLFVKQRGTSEGELLALAAALCAVVLVDAWLRLLERRRAEMLGQDYVLEVRGKLFEHLAGVSPRMLRSQSRGGMLLRFVGDLTPLRQWLSQGVARLAVAGVVVPTGLVALAFVGWKLSAWVLVVLAAGAGATLAQGRRLQRATRDVRRLRSHLATNVSEKLSSMAVVQLHGQERRECRRLERQGRRLFGAMIARASSIGRVRAIIHATMGLATLGVLGFGVHEVIGGRATPGAVVAAMTLAGLIVRPLQDMSPVFENWQGTRISREKLEGFLGLPAARRASATRRRKNRGRGELRFERVSVTAALQGIEATAEAGCRTAIVGPNGSGKSTLLALAAGLIEPSQGRVLLDGKNLARLRARDVRRAVGMAGGDLPLLRGTIRRNLCYRRGTSPQELARVCALCGVDEVIEGLPQGLDTRIREGGVGLSQGQRQRLALARAILGAPDVLLLDEVDSNLDAGSRACLERVLADYPGTVLMATHDLDLARSADAIWRLEGGRLVAEVAPVVEVQ